MVFNGCLTKSALYCTWLDLGESRVFDRGLTTGGRVSEEMQKQLIRQ